MAEKSCDGRKVQWWQKSPVMAEKSTGVAVKSFEVKAVKSIKVKAKILSWDDMKLNHKFKSLRGKVDRWKTTRNQQNKSHQEQWRVKSQEESSLEKSQVSTTTI